MSLNLRSLGRALFVGGFVGACFVACAEGSNLPAPDPGTGGNGAGGTGTGIPPGQIGGTCVNDESCKVEGSSCVQIGGESYCTVACPPQCPKGTYCAIINGDPMCVPDLESQCLPCTTILQCLNPSDACLTAPAGDKFCARDCTTTGECPNGFTCLEGAKYPPKQNPDPGGADAGTDGGSDGGTDGGTTEQPSGNQTACGCAGSQATVASGLGILCLGVAVRRRRGLLVAAHEIEQHRQPRAEEHGEEQEFLQRGTVHRARSLASPV